MNNVPEAVLQECLDYMEQGESVDAIIARFPEVGAELRPFLETAVQLAALAPQPSLAAKQQSQKMFLAHAASLKVPPIRPSTWYRVRQILLPLASLALLLILFSTAAVSVSASAIPGDALYPVKRLVENVRLNRTDDPTAAADLLAEFDQERIREVQTLLRTGRSAEVTFDGLVEMIQPEEWTVAKIDVALVDETQLVGRPKVGDLVRVNGRTDRGTITAITIELLNAASTTPEPEPTPIPTAVPTRVPTLTPTATLKPTTSPTREATVIPTTGPTAAPTVTPELPATIVPTLPPPPTATPLPTQPPGDDNGNDNGDDGNSNDDDDDGNSNGGGNDNGNDNNDNDDDDSNDNNDNGGGNDNDDDDDNGNDGGGDDNNDD